jgi:microcystin-dependent protein
MARDVNGNYTLPVGTPVVSGTVVSSVAFNTFAADVGSELTNSVDRAGRGAPTADLPMGGHRHTNVANANARNTYTATADVQDQNTVWCGVAGGTANALTLTPVPAITQYKDGQKFSVKVGAATNSGAVTAAVSGLAALPVVKNGGTALAANDLPPNGVMELTVNNTQAQLELNKVKLGSISAQDSNNVAITGGTLDGTVIGGVTPAAATATNLTATQQLTASGVLVASGVQSPAAIAGNTNDYAPANLAITGVLRLSSTARFNVTGLIGGSAGRMLLVHNIGIFPIVFTPSDALSAAANRFAFGTTLGGGQSMLIQYDGVSSLWRGLSIPEPIGTIKEFAAGTLPAGYLLRDGSNVSRTGITAPLFNEVGTTWGVGDGATTFGVGDDRRRVAVGSGGSGTGTLGNTVGNSGGEEAHALAIGELPSHAHNMSNIFSAYGGSDVGNNNMSGSGTGTGFGSAAQGSNTAHNNIQPSNIVTKMIRYC